MPMLTTTTTAMVLLMTMMVLTTTMMVRETGAQKVDKDGMESDRYHMRDAEASDGDRDSDQDNKDLKYVVTEEVFLDVMINNSKTEEPYKGRITIACFGEITPITCLNFVALAKGHQFKSKKLRYKNTPVHRVIRDFVIQMGDVTGGNGKSGTSIYGESFQDENFKLSHRAAGWVSMANHGRHTNGSQFFILLQPARWLDGKHVVFGKVVKGMDVIRKLGDVPTTVSNRPKGTVMIVDSGVIGIPSKYQLTEKEVISAEDIK